MPALTLGLLALVVVASVESFQVLAIPGDCPLNLSWANWTSIASACSNQNERAKCCRYINAFVTVSVARYTNTTGTLGVPSASSDFCLSSLSESLQSSGVASNATIFCGLGPKIRVAYPCDGRETILEMLQSPNFSEVIKNCKMPLSSKSSCRRCLNSSIIYLRRLIGVQDNVTLNTCRDAVFVALANQGDNISAVDMASCFFSVEGLSIVPGNASEPSTQSHVPEASPSPLSAQAPIQHLIGLPHAEHHHKYQLSLIPGLGIMVAGVAILLLLILILLIRKKSRELKGANTTIQTTRDSSPPQAMKLPEGQLIIFRRFSYKEIIKATNNFNTVLGRSRFGTVYKAKLGCGSLAAVKRMNQLSEQGEEEFCREIERLSRLHHRHLVALRGFCVQRHKRLLIYEYMENGSLKDHLHFPGKTPLRWRARIRIAIDVANALEYLHFYCDPPLCHGNIKSSNILLDENYLAKVTDHGLVHADGLKFEPGTAGCLDPDYMASQELTENNDIYSYGVLLLELVTGRQAIQDDQNLVEWSRRFMATESLLPELVDVAITDSLDQNQLQDLVSIIQWCIQEEGKARPTIKQVLRKLYQALDPAHTDFMQAMEEEERGYARGETNKSKAEVIPHSGDARCLQSSSSTSRSYCSRSVLLDSGSPQSPHGIF